MTFCAISTLSAKEILVIATNDDYPPFILKNQKHSFLPDLFDEIGDQMGVTFEFRYLPWQRCAQAVQNHEAWGAIPYTRNEERDKIYDFSDPIYFSDAKFFAYDPKGEAPQISYRNLSDLDGWTIGGIQGYYYVPMFTKAGLDVDYVHSEEQNIKRLQLGRIDLTPLPSPIGWYLINKLFPPDVAKNFYTLEKPLLSEASLHVMASKNYPNNANLLVRFNAALAEIKNNGTFAELINRHGLVLSF